MFLQGVGGALLAVPFLESLAPGSARAADGTARRFVAIKSYSTQNIIDWYPTLSGNGYNARPLAGGAKEDGTTILTQALAESSGSHASSGPYFGHEAPLADFSEQGASNILGPELNPFLDKMLLLRGLDFLPDTNHNAGGMLGNYAASDQAAASILPRPTIDQVLAWSNKFYPPPPAGTRSLHMRLGNANSFSFTHAGIPGGEIQQLQAHTDPLTAFGEAFGNVQLDPEAPTEHRNLALVDRVYEDYANLRQHQRLGGADRLLLERHMQFLSELGAKLDASSSILCNEPTAPGSVNSGSGVDVAMIEAATNAFVDVAIAALRCDVTRIVTLDLFKAIGRGVAPGGGDLGFIHSGLMDPVDWHETAHNWGDPTADAKIRAINEWIAREVFLRFLEELDVEAGVSGETFLDDTVIMWGNELGFNHLNWSIPTLLAGGAGGALQMGRYIDYIDWDQPAKFGQNNGAVIEGVPYNRLLVTLLQAFGLEASDYEPLNHGEAGYGSTSTAGKSASSHAIDYDFGQVGAPLPDVLV